eukprot:TRINITY_DN32643_c0_g1_i1.p1 TRINITY_DN32643_c0_g1~~TRINITY_DN32643_c0_g1_i1.p1  ORF type:complete len:265 (-),score=57.59 TRINITY_DN32643_c0_g1_i1:24-818(-)
MSSTRFGWNSIALTVAAAGGVAALLLNLTRFLSVRESRRASEVLAIIVPGGGLKPDGTPTPWVRRRLAEAAKIYKAERAKGRSAVIVALSAGTPHKPMPIDAKSKFNVFEAEAGARWLVREESIPPEDVFEENWSLDTIGNAYMLRAMHTEVAGWQRLIVVNNEFHMPRTKAIFDKVFALSPLPNFGAYEIEYVEVPNDGVEAEVLAARKEREAKSTAGFRKNSANIDTMRQMHRFIFVNHGAYASTRLLKDREPIDPKAAASY